MALPSFTQRKLSQPAYFCLGIVRTFYTFGMRENRPSQTAAMVALMRAMADAGITEVRGFSDPTAHKLLPQPWSALYSFVTWRLRGASPERRRRVSIYADIMPLRTRAIDEELVQALAAGCTQVVILGAGLDGRAHRLRELAAARVFEVDHPASQAYKRRRAAPLVPLCRELVYVSVDFERETVGERLRQSGHHAEEKTAFILEGVVMYLSDPALRKTLLSVARCAASGSVLMCQYSEPGGRSQAAKRWSWFTTLVGEPQIGLRTQATMAAELQRAGFQVLSDSGADDWAQRFANSAPLSRIAPKSRLVVAKPLRSA
jgi:methyltransferase (TIGR00027 family)